MTASRRISHALALTGATLLAACGPSAKTSPVTPAGEPPPAAQTVTVQVDAPPTALATGSTYRLAAAVTGTADTRVTWRVNEAGGGAVDGTGLYTAPGAAGSYHVRATSVADTNAYGEATVTVAVVAPVAVTVTPSPGAVDACRTLQLTARVTNAANTAVAWSVQEGAAGGTVSASGLYTAPANAGTYHVVATSVQDPTRSYVVAVTVSDRVLSVALSPSAVTLQPGQTQQFVATVTTTCGTATSTTSVTAPL